MAKKKKLPQVQLLSPENYIRQKGRGLPIYECRIISNWEKMGSTQIIISRIHANGNITLGFYEVDLFCLGISDSYFVFNISKDDYDHLLATSFEEVELIKVDYVLVHNILFAAKEYADELGFKPPKDFSSVTQYLLDEDTEDIELIEITCGNNGKPFFVRTKSISDADANRIIKQLEKAVGKGNFDVIDGYDFDETDFDDQFSEFGAMDRAERRKLFLEMDKKDIEKSSVEDHKRLIALIDSIYVLDICDEQIVEKLIDSWEVEVNMDISDQEYTPESLGMNPDCLITVEDMDHFEEIFPLLEKNPEKAEKLLDELRAQWGNIPYICYLELKSLEKVNPNEYKQKLVAYSMLYPNYPLIKLCVYLSFTLKQEDQIQLLNFDDVFGGRSSITNFEMFDFQTKKTLGIIARKNMNELDAIYSNIDDLELNEEYFEYLKMMLFLSRINLLKEYFANN